MSTPDLDSVDQASADSFPASDPPAWSAAHAAPSESTVLTPEILARRRRVRALWIGGGVLMFATLITGITLGARYLRAR